MLRQILFAALLLAMLTLPSLGQLSIRAVDVAGDSISKGYNAGNSFPCSNGDQETYNWLSSDTHSTDLCSTGPENVYSFLERLECTLNFNILARNPNSAASGARLLTDFVNQANSIKTYLNEQPAPRLAAVFLGHNDNCSGVNTKSNASCSSTDLDPANYCRTKNDAFERELRKGLDVLMSVPDTQIGVAAPVRVSQLCNFGSKTNCQIAGTCQFLWGVVNICGSLTTNCSDARIIDTYTTMKAYRDIIKRVTAEYALITDNGVSPVVMIGGQIVGGGTKAPGTTFQYSDAAWMYKFSASQISCCDCFHPSQTGQNTLGRMMKDGLACSPFQPCCKETGDPLTDAKCLKTERRRVFYRGLY